MSAANPSGAQGGATDPLSHFDASQRAAFSDVAAHLIPAAHGMPSAAEVIDDARLRFVLTARPDLIEPLSSALDAVPQGQTVERLRRLESEAPDRYGVVTFVVVASYYTDANVRRLIGYPGQERILPDPSFREAYLDEGLLDEVIARGPVWKDPTTGRRAQNKEPS